jgi:flagellar biosynthesis GTPase FlhF
MDDEGYLLVPQRRTRKPSSCNSLERVSGARMCTTAPVPEQHSYGKTATLQVLVNYCALKENNGDYLLEKRKPNRHKSLEQTPAKSDDIQAINSADSNTNNNKQNYYKVIESEDDENIEDNVAKTKTVNRQANKTEPSEEKTIRRIDLHQRLEDRNQTEQQKDTEETEEREISSDIENNLAQLLTKDADTLHIDCLVRTKGGVHTVSRKVNGDGTQGQ